MQSSHHHHHHTEKTEAGLKGLCIREIMTEYTLYYTKYYTTTTIRCANDFSTIRRPIHAKVCMRAYSGSGCSGVARGGFGRFKPSIRIETVFFHSRKVTVIKYYNLSLTTRKTILTRTICAKPTIWGGVIASMHRMRLDLDL